MCGITGCYIRNKLSPKAIHNTELALNVLRHRGPDDNGIYIDNSTVMGHTRLSIVDPSGGVQPMTNEDSSLWITFNGEIFNYPELKEYLIKKGHIFRTNSDTEVILHLYEEKKEKCLDYLNGQFAFSVRDNLNDELFIARDHSGILPLFYTTTTKGEFVFASEIKALFCFTGEEQCADIKAMDQIFTFWTTLPGTTFFKGIYELPPAHYIKIKKGEIFLRRYWEHNFSGMADHSEKKLTETVEEVSALLLDSVRIRLRADVPVGCYLSGGIDSSGITSLVHNNFNNELRTFGIIFEEEDFNELKYQQEVISYLNTNHLSLTVSNNGIVQNFVKMICNCEKPVLRTAAVPMMLLSELVNKNGYKVVLSGEGGDEIFGGYNIFKETYIRRFWSQRPLSEKRPLLLKKIYPYIFKDTRGYEFNKKFFGSGINNPDSPFFSHEIRWSNTSRIKKFYSDDLAGELEDYNPLNNLLQILPESFSNWNWFAKAQYLEFILFLNGYLLSSQGDRAAMSNSVELRVPYLDHRLIEYMAKIPVSLKLRGLNEKYLLKKIFRNKLPSGTINRTKHPFRAPVNKLFENNLWILDEYCSDEKLKDTGFFNPEKTSMLIKKVRMRSKFSETDNMALTGILSAQIIYYSLMKNYKSSAGLEKPNHIFDFRTNRESI
ncbi:MAG: asparagine synthase (glutamine-hydrolyzing) [Ignavibacteriaceae bacterium]